MPVFLPGNAEKTIQHSRQCGAVWVLSVLLFGQRPGQGRSGAVAHAPPLSHLSHTPIPCEP